MGRIEDALNKLRKAGRSGAVPPTRLATVVPQQHDYAGRRVVVDVAELMANGLLAPGAAEHRLDEQYRVIKRPLLRNASPDHVPPIPRGNLLMVASALAGEGKTFTSVNLCLSIARERDWEIVLIDADCSKRHLTHLFAAEKERGLVDLLRDTSLTFDSVVMPTDVPGLSLMPAGSPDEQSSELLASNRMDELCAALAEGGAGRMIVFDSSPLLLTTEAVALAQHVGQIALVVRANETPHEAVLAAIDRLDPSKAIGCILNQAYGSESGLKYGDDFAYGD